MDEDGELHELDDAAPETVRDTADGGAIVTLDDEDGDVDDAEFYANLAETLSNSELQTLAASLVQQIERDKEARNKRDKQYEDGLRRTGLGNDAPGGAEFEGANKVVHPMLTEACVDFAARAMKELFPQGGPVKTAVTGKPTDAKLRKAKRKTALLNWQLTVQCKEVRAEIEQLMTQLPLGGAQYLKVSWRESRNRPNFLFVAIDDMLLPYAATNFYTAQRKTHVQYLTQFDYEQRVKEGMYRDADLAPAGMDPEGTASGRANDKIEGRTATSYNEDGLRTVFETYAQLDIEGDDKVDGTAPYIVTIDKVTNAVLAIYRNWDEDDEALEELQWFVEWPFIPWRGAYPIGLPHMIGGLSAAATGSLRALLDSAHISNAATMVKLKGGGIGGQSVEVKPTQVVELEGGLNVDDIRKLAMPMPFNPPSDVLFQLLGFVTEAGKSVVRTSMEDIADSNANTPVGTTLARIEQGMVVFSAIHGRLCDSMTRMLEILDRLNGRYLDEDRLLKEAGEALATKADFGGASDVIPVSDPNVFSEVQRYGQVQAITQRAQLLPQLYNLREVEKRLLQVLKIPDSDALLAPEQNPTEQNAVAENAAAALARPITAFPAQDHLAHLATHVEFMQSPLFGGIQTIAQSLYPVMLNHLKEHLVLWYASAVLDTATQAVGRDVGEMLREMSGEEDVDHTDEKKRLDRLLAMAAPIAMRQAQQNPLLTQLPQIIQQASQMLQQMQPAPQDPRLAIEGQKVQLQGQKLQQDAALQGQKLQLEGQKMQLEGQKVQADVQLSAHQLQQQAALKQAELQLQGQTAQLQAQGDERQRMQDTQLAALEQQHEDARKLAEIQAKQQMNAEDNETAAQIAAAEIAAGHKSPLSTGTGINPDN